MFVRTLLWICLALATACAQGRLPELPRADWSQAPRWPLPPEKPRVVWVGEIRTGKDIVARPSLWRRVLGSSDAEALQRPTGVAVDPEGRIFVADPGGPAVFVFDPRDGSTVRVAAGPDQALQSPVGVAIAEDGAFFVSDSKLGMVFAYDKNARPTGVLGNGVLKRPTGLAYDPQARHLWVVDTLAHGIRVFDRAGKLVREIGEAGSEPGQMHYPAFIALAGGGRPWVVDGLNARVQALEPNGTVRLQVGQKGDSPGDFARPKGIAVDSERHIYVADALFDNIQVFDSQGRLLLYFGSSGRGPGQFWLPLGVAIDGDDRIFVADSFNHRIQIFRYLREGT